MLTDPVLLAKDGANVFLFPGLVIWVLWCGLGFMRIGYQCDGKSDEMSISHEDFREVILM